MSEQAEKFPLSNALIATAAGLASALLFIVATRGAFGAALLGYFASLPLMIAAISYGLRTGLVAVAVGIIAVALMLGLAPCLFFSFGVAVPALLLSVAMVFAPFRAEGSPHDLAPAIGVLVSAGLSTFTTLASLLLFVWRAGSYQAAMTAAEQRLAPVIAGLAHNASLPPSLQASDLMRMVIIAIPALMAGSGFFMLLFNQWLAGRIALLGGTLPRPWPVIADNLSLPLWVGMVFVLACCLALINGIFGVAASVLAASLGAAFSLQGLAVAHILTRRASIRPVLLTLLYLLIAMVPVWPIIALAVVGVIDAAFHLRTRSSATTPS